MGKSIAIIYLCICALLGLCDVKARKKKSILSTSVSRVLSTAGVTILGYVCVLIFDEFVLFKIGYSIYFSGIVWLCYFFMKYTEKFTGAGTRYHEAANPFFIVLCVLDTLSLMVSLWIGQMKTVIPQSGKYGNLNLEGGSYAFLGHMIICYLFVLISIITLVSEIKNSPAVYKVQCAGVLVIYLFVVTISAVFTFTSLALDLSLIAFAAAAVLMYYFSFNFATLQLGRSIGDVILKDMKDSVICFDRRGYLLLENEKAKDNFGILEKEDTLGNFCERINLVQKKNMEESFSRDMEVTAKEGKIKNYKCRYQRILDNKNRYMGCYFQIADVTKDVKKYQEQQYLVEHDAVTGLYNKMTFCKKTKEILTRYPEDEFVIVCSNIREFKLINENYGSAVGDEILKYVGSIIKEKTNEKEIGCRMESDHFAILVLKSASGIEQFKEVSRIPVLNSEDKRYVQNYFGIYPVIDRTEKVESMCERALMALDTIKGTYQSDFIVYDDAMREKLIREQRIQERLPMALDTGEICLYIQPQIDSVTGEPNGAEALVRWMDKEKGMISPGDFVPVFEKCGLITKLDQYVWECTCKLLSQWKREGLRNIPMSVNISGCDFFYTDLYRDFTTLIERYSISPDMLRLEITESSFAEHNSQLEVVKKLREFGFTVEMDDFGSGYSSLNMLKSVPVDIIKLDMGFLQSCEKSPKGIAIMKSVIELAKNLKLPVIAEGVETIEQVRLLQGMGCYNMQGYYYFKPLPVNEYEKIIR